MDPKPKIAIFGINYSPEPTGIAPYTAGLAKGLVARGFPVRVTTTHEHYPQWRLPSSAAWVKRESIAGVPVARLLHYVPAAPRGLLRLLSEVSFGVRAVLRPWGNPDVVLSVSPALLATAMIALRVKLSRRKPKLVVWTQDLYALGMAETGEGSRVSALVVKMIERCTLKLADRVVVIHSRFGVYLGKSLAVNSDRIEVVRNWTHLKSMALADESASRIALGWRQDETVVLHAGNMGAKQALANVVEAARLADSLFLPVRFVLLGNGGERDFLGEMGAGIERLQFLDSLDDGDFQSALRAADVLLVNEKPGVADMAVPSKLTSYFNAGRPILAATAIAGITAEEIRRADAGVIVPAGAPQELLDGVLALRDNDGEAARLGANGKRYRDEVLGEETALAQFSEMLMNLAR